MIIAILVKPLYYHAVVAVLGRDYDVISIIRCPCDPQAHAEGASCTHVCRIPQDFHALLVSGVGFIR